MYINLFIFAYLDRCFQGLENARKMHVVGTCQVSYSLLVGIMCCTLLYTINQTVGYMLQVKI
jgi:hypothetical protein